MNLKKKLILYILAVIGTAALILVIFGILNKAGYNNLVEILVAVAAVISLLLKLRGKPSDLTMIQYKETYAEFVKGAFENDKKSYKKLIEACAYFGESKFDKAHKLLDKLLEKCTCTRDYQVVYNVKAICYAKEGRDEPLVEIYKKL